MRKFSVAIAVGMLVAFMAFPTTGLGAGAVDKGQLIGGVDLTFTMPTNALRRTTKLGGSFSPYVGYMFFEPEDKRLNLGVMGQLSALGLSRGKRLPGGPDAQWPTGVPAINLKNSFAFWAGAGPRVTLPISKVELHGHWVTGVMTGLNSGPIADTSWGFSTGGGIDYAVMDNFKVGIVGNWNRWYQKVHGIGDVRFVNAGFRLQYNTTPPPPPPPPPPPVVVEEEEVVEVIVVKKKIVLRGVNFAFDKAAIRADDRPILDEAIGMLDEAGDAGMVAQGYTDSTGPEAYNMQLSVRRANAVRDYLVEGGIASSRIAVEGFGESDPVASNATREGRAQNRRVELRVVE